MNSYNVLLYDLQMLVDSLNDTIKVIETGASKTDIEACLHCDGDVYRRDIDAHDQREIAHDGQHA